VLPQRNPLLVAGQAATIHHLSNGRLIHRWIAIAAPIA
jgi:alkanesulfonate monooxygenase SsuD/methylene tetrahydromethanopterin reductase-like flavin-dependent oxidoreductase (luciferase family)